MLLCISCLATNLQTTSTISSNLSMLNTDEGRAPSPPWNNDQFFFDAIDALDAERADDDNDYNYIFEDIYDEAIVSKRDNSKSSVPSVRAAKARCVKKNKIDVKASPPSFRESKSDMQQLAAAYLGHRVELFCPHRKGCPRGNITWIKDGEVLKRRGRKSGLSIVRMK